MNHPPATSVCVIIAAWRSRLTISRAVRSALAEPEVSEVLVVDDASMDDTAEAAWAADDGTGRLRILHQARNLGPAAARNRALSETLADYVALLDADDYYLPGRFATLFKVPGWDAIADNIAFVDAQVAGASGGPNAAISEGSPQILSLKDFLEGSISKRGVERGELGFLKPVMRRSFLEENCLHYDESLRLGEDFHLYARMMAKGAKFLVTPFCGYVAVERSESLSSRHSTQDLESLLAAVDTWSSNAVMSAAERAVLGRYRARLRENFRHRRFLDRKRESGVLAAVSEFKREPDIAVRVAIRIVRDKLTRRKPKNIAESPIRFLLPN